MNMSVSYIKIKDKWKLLLNKLSTLNPRYFFVAIFIISFSVVVFRRVDILSYPQFWAEDGTLWFEDAYNLGFSSLFIPRSGYFQTISRLVAWGSQLFPFVYAPLVFNLMAIIIKIIPILFIFSIRYRKNFSSLVAPTTISLVYLFLPNTSEVYANITNTHTYLAVIAFLILTADKSPSKTWKLFDIFFLLLAGLSGPFIVFLFPIATIWWWLNRHDYISRLHIVIISLCFLVQFSAILLTGASRTSMILGATPALFVKITSGQIFLGALVGKEGFATLYNNILFVGGLKSSFFYVSIFLLGFSSVIWSLRYGQNRLRLFLIFVSTVYVFALLKPMASTTTAQWPVMLLPGNATRYWFLPMLGFLLSVIFLLHNKNPRPIRFFGFCILLIMFYGIKFELIYKPWTNLSFSSYAKQFETLSPGDKLEIPIMPPNWHKMRLIKR